MAMNVLRVFFTNIAAHPIPITKERIPTVIILRGQNTGKLSIYMA